MARLFVIIGGLIVLVLTAVLVVPYFIDWTSYKAEFEREASRILGRDVVVRGSARARLLPLPSVTFTDVEVAGTKPGEPAITVETFSMDAELAPFLRGELLIFDMRIERPKARIAIDENGTVDWALRPSTPFDASQVTLEKVSIVEGRIDVDHAASGRTHALTEVNADISARTLAGPWRMSGSLRVDGTLTALSVSTGALEDTGTMRLRVRAEPDRYGFGLETDGHAGLSDGVFGYDGTFKLAARKVERLRGAEGETFELAEDAGADNAPPAYRVSGDFGLNHQQIDISEFRFETGPLVDPYVANGHASITLGTEPRFEISADGAQLRFEDVTDASDGSLALSARLAAFKEVMFDLPKPEIPGKIEVKLPAIVAGDTTVRNVNLSAEPVEKGWAIASASATLPGRATLEG
ncbi:MAG: AsmA family protein, partial [Rhizobiaceae bacterium]|nr:AsmA family protein [Rhizobiaceae bacterium]